MAQNFLSPVGFLFSLKRAPNIEYYTQKVSLPGLTAGFAPLATPFNELGFSADKVQFEDLSLDFRVDENMSNYLEIFNWIVGLTFPDNFTQHSNLASTDNPLGERLYSDATLTVMNSNHNPNISIVFQNMFPLSLSSIDLDVTANDIQYPTATVTFKYQQFTIEVL